MHPPPQDRQWPVRSFSLAHVPSLIHLHLSSEKSSAARGDFFTEQRKSSLKYDEMWELMVKKGIMMEMISWMQQWVWGVKVLCLSEVEEGPAGWARPAVWN